MGKSGSGKTSMRSIIFANYIARDTRRLGATIGKVKCFFDSVRKCFFSYLHSPPVFKTLCAGKILDLKKRKNARDDRVFSLFTILKTHQLHVAC